MLYAMIFDKTNDNCTFLIEECLMVLFNSSSFPTPKLYFIFFFADNIPADYNPNLPN